MKKVAKAVVIDDHDKYLLLVRANHPTFGDDADLPGGLVEDNETTLQGAVREVAEEMNITIAPTDFEQLFAGSDYSPHGTHYALYQVRLARRPDIELSWEHSDYRWLDRDQFLTACGQANDIFMHMVADVLRKVSKANESQPTPSL